MTIVTSIVINLATILTGVGTMIYIVGRRSGQLDGIEKRLERIERILNHREED